MNALERAVIEAARVVITTKITDSTPLCPGGPGLTNALLLLADKIAALDEHKRELEARPCFQAGEMCATHDRHFTYCEARK